MKNLLESFNHFTNLIEQEKAAYEFCLCADLNLINSLSDFEFDEIDNEFNDNDFESGSFDTNLNDSEFESDDFGADFADDTDANQNEIVGHLTKLLCYYGLRIKCSLSLMQENEKKYFSYLKEDLSSLFDAFKDFSDSSKIDRYIVSYTMEYLTALCPDQKSVLLHALPMKYRLFRTVKEPISESMIYAYIYIAQCFYQEGYRSEALQVFKLLLDINHKYTPHNSEMYYFPVTQIVQLLHLAEPVFTLEIIESEKNIFSQFQNNDTANLYFIYATLLEANNRPHDALAAYNTCYKIRKSLFGDNDWDTAVARFEYCRFALHLKDSAESIPYLYQFIDRIEDDLYLDTPDAETVKLYEGRAFRALLHHLHKHQQLSDSFHYIKLYKNICEEFNDDPGKFALKNRLAYNYEGAYYWEKGDLLQAEQAYQHAIDSYFPKDTPLELISIQELQLNLAVVLSSLNDYENASALLKVLLDDHDTNSNTTLSGADYYRLLNMHAYWIALSIIEPEDKDFERFQDILDAYNASPKSKFTAAELWDNPTDVTICLISSIITVFINNRRVSSAELNLYYRLLKKAEASVPRFLSKRQQVSYYTSLVTVCNEIDHFDTSRYTNILLELTQQVSVPLMIKASVYSLICGILYRRQDISAVEKYMNILAASLTEDWHDAIQYINDTRLSNILMNTQRIFYDFYAISRKIKSNYASYEDVLRYKSLAALAARERNRNLRNHSSLPLLRQIADYQNQLADAESANWFQNKEIDTAPILKKLRRLEAEFHSLPIAEASKCTFIDISLSRVIEAIPDNSLVVEYVVSTSDFARTASEMAAIHQSDKDLLVIDIFILRKKDGKLSMKKMTVCNAADILNKAAQFVMILQRESLNKQSVDDAQNKEGIRECLFTALIEPVKDLLNGIHTLYFAPDSTLVNLPFELLCDSSIKSTNAFDILRIESARDFLFTQASSTAFGTLILGGPQYDTAASDSFSGALRSGNLFADPQTEKLSPLPFSELEAIKIGTICNAPAYVYDQASKKRLLEAHHPKNIHISTHGVFDLEYESDSAYSSAILLAGAQTWINTGTVSAIYGNGCVTADEISRMDLHSTQLVVISSCLSGMNDTLIQKNFNGLISAFSAAGVKYVITHMWSADDIPSAVLMEEFYHYYIEKHMEPPAALRAAKKKLQLMTINDIADKGWLAYTSQVHPGNITPKSEDSVKRLQNMLSQNKSICPFRKESCWAGFSCYRCN